MTFIFVLMRQEKANKCKSKGNLQCKDNGKSTMSIECKYIITQLPVGAFLGIWQNHCIDFKNSNNISYPGTKNNRMSNNTVTWTGCDKHRKSKSIVIVCVPPK